MKNKIKLNEVVVDVAKPEDVAIAKKGLTNTDKIVVGGKPNDTSMTNNKSPQIPQPPEAQLGESQEIDSVIEPQDSATIKYLSNVTDNETGEISKPFTISDKNYQMVRGVLPSKEIVLGVYCFDDVDGDGNNVIHSVDYFDKNIAGPMKEMMESELLQNSNTQQSDSDNFEGYKHYFVNKKTNEVRKFKNIKELVSQNKLDDEEYMGVKEFKQHMNEKLFGKRRQKVTEDDPLGGEKEDVTKAIDAMVDKLKPYMAKLNHPIEKIQFIVKLTKMMNLPANRLPLLISELKKGADESFTAPDSNVTTPIPAAPETASSISESKKFTKKELINSLLTNKVNRIIKIKDIK